MSWGGVINTPSSAYGAQTITANANKILVLCNWDSTIIEANVGGGGVVGYGEYVNNVMIGIRRRDLTFNGTTLNVSAICNMYKYNTGASIETPNDVYLAVVKVYEIN